VLQNEIQNILILDPEKKHRLLSKLSLEYLTPYMKIDTTQNPYDALAKIKTSCEECRCDTIIIEETRKTCRDTNELNLCQKNYFD